MFTGAEVINRFIANIGILAEPFHGNDFFVHLNDFMSKEHLTTISEQDHLHEHGWTKGRATSVRGLFQ